MYTLLCIQIETQILSDTDGDGHCLDFVGVFAVDHSERDRDQLVVRVFGFADQLFVHRADVWKQREVLQETVSMLHRGLLHADGQRL